MSLRFKPSDGEAFEMSQKELTDLVAFVRNFKNRWCPSCGRHQDGASWKMPDNGDDGEDFTGRRCGHCDRLWTP